jgi:hypothetical protein
MFWYFICRYTLILSDAKDNNTISYFVIRINSERINVFVSSSDITLCNIRELTPILDFNKNFSGHQPCYMFKILQRSGNHLCPHHQDHKPDNGDREGPRNFGEF